MEMRKRGRGVKQRRGSADCARKKKEKILAEEKRWKFIQSFHKSRKNLKKMN